MWKAPDARDEDEEEEDLVFGITPKKYARIHMSGKFKSANLAGSQVVSASSVKEDLKNSGKWTDKIVILHTGLAFRLYQKIIVLLKTYSCFIYSYYAGYRVSDDMTFW